MVVAAFELLDLISRRPGLNLSELARQSGFTVNRTFRLLGTLEGAGWVSRSRHKTYYLGPRLMMIAARGSKQDPLVQAARLPMDWLSEQTGESVRLGVRVGETRTIVSSRESRFPLQVSVWLDDNIPLYAGALGCCLLAFSPRELQEKVLAGPLERGSEASRRDPTLLAAHLEQVRRSRVDAVIDHRHGLYSIASPILDHDGMAVGALGIFGATLRLPAEGPERYFELVREAAERTARQLHGG
ncbi:DNA-binding IclR family transcriptional regulator [Deinobacterium chartae]|uniref:DNA-binding IclR family transcriptional regulator n=1 Tax=Deinobacterium chartae TaxID=521158 RepID=A0A841I522_9DEIO|nr:IclR family transcriptional regulator [Deinobacterium chartae]MBB6100134.1 DNA-binding IclR family transcriptional regulator [Deinobacterium chartae]